MNKFAETLIDWEIPAGKQDWLMGTGVTSRERAVVWSATIALAIGATAVAKMESVHWTWWQWALVLVLAVDVAGGVPANALGTAKRFYHSPTPPELSAPKRLLRHPVAFSALHFHPFVVLLLPGVTFGWAVAWYLLVLGGTVLVVAAPLYLQRAVAASIITVGLIVAPMVEAPPGLAWLGPVLVLKLVIMHAVHEEPYRPASTSRKASTSR